MSTVARSSSCMKVALVSGLAVLGLGACSTMPSHQEVRRPPSGSASVKIQTINNKLLVPVMLNGSQPATLLLDTGASTSVISADLARRLGIDSGGAVRARARIASGQEVDVSLVRLKSLSVGSARIDDFRVAVYELAVLNSSPTLPVAIEGFLGMDFIGRFTMTLDPRAATLTFQPGP